MVCDDALSQSNHSSSCAGGNHSTQRLLHLPFGLSKIAGPRHMYKKRREEIRNNSFCYRLLSDYLEMNLPRRLRLTMPEGRFLGHLKPSQQCDKPWHLNRSYARTILIDFILPFAAYHSAPYSPIHNPILWVRPQSYRHFSLFLPISAIHHRLPFQRPPS